ncbi:MAG: helix-turn-helix domain-containing protein [Kiritimatiellia bacterium]
MPETRTTDLTSVLSGELIGLDWLRRVTCLETDSAVRTDWHAHDYTELICCLKGEHVYELERRAPTTLCAGMCLVVPAGKRHRLLDSIDAPGRRLGLAILPRNARRQRLGVFTSADLRELYARLLAKRCLSFACPQEALRQFRTLAEFVARDRESVAPQEWCVARIACCSILASVALARDSEETGLQPFEIAEAVRYIRDHAHEALNLDDLVRHVGYSRARFFDLFRKHTGLTPHDYWLRRRIELAKAGLKKTARGIGAVARSCGFPDVASFSRVFRRYVGVPPTAFRRQRSGD